MHLASVETKFIKIKKISNFRFVKEITKRFRLNVAFSWAIFTLGVSQLALIIGGPIAFMIILICCASLFLFVIFKMQPQEKRSRTDIVVPFLLCTGILLVITVLYTSFVFLNNDLSNIIFISLNTSIFLVPLLIVAPVIRKSLHVAK
jgi:hypothetical protein